MGQQLDTFDTIGISGLSQGTPHFVKISCGKPKFKPAIRRFFNPAPGAVMR